MTSIVLVEDHHSALPYWLQNLQPRSRTLIHIDEHIDFVRRPPDEVAKLISNQDNVDSVRGNRHLLQHGLFDVDDFLASAMVLKLFDRILWIKPSNAIPFPRRFRDYLAHLDFVTIKELDTVEVAVGIASIHLSDAEIIAVDCNCLTALQLDDWQPLTVSIDLDFYDKATIMDVRFVDRILREAVSIKLDSPVVISFSVNGGYLHPRRTENLLKLAKIIFNRSQIVIYPNNDRLPDSFNRAFRALRKSSFNIAASLFKNDDSVSLSIREHYAGHAYWRGGIEEKARRLWISALVHAPEQWETRAQLGILLSHSLQTNDRSLSRDLLMSALVERPHSYRLLLSLARLEMIDNPDKAQAYLRRAKRIRPAAVDARIFEKELYHLVN